MALNFSDSESSVSRFIHRFQMDEDIQENITAWNIIPPASAQWSPLPFDVDPEIVRLLKNNGIHQIYTHQRLAYEALENGKNVVIATGTASGKTLCYQLPILNQICRRPSATALMIFPTKALAYDQYEQLVRISPEWINQKIAVYDGDTPQHIRSQLRNRAQIILTNPDMLHSAILPHHTIWEKFLKELSYVVIDEIHVYRGVFGSHLANVIRRLKRVAGFYGTAPQFALTSATISNPLEHAENLIEAPVEIIDSNGAPHGQRNFILYNPPFLNKDLGIRRSAMSEATWLAGKLLDEDIQTLLFAQTRRAVELGVKYLQDSHPNKADSILAYRSGYLAVERRRIERALKTGTAQLWHRQTPWNWALILAPWTRQ